MWIRLTLLLVSVILFSSAATADSWTRNDALQFFLEGVRSDPNMDAEREAIMTCSLTRTVDGVFQGRASMSREDMLSRMQRAMDDGTTNKLLEDCLREHERSKAKQPSAAATPHATSATVASASTATPDTRSPAQRYQGAYTGAWLLCTLSKRLSLQVEEMDKRGIEVEPDTRERADVLKCINKGLADLKTEYTSFSALIKGGEAGKKALTDHYVAAILHVKATQGYIGEDWDTYIARINSMKDQTDELWVRFEITQP